jgi:hypothetical protein
MRKLILVLGLVVVAIACGETAGEMLTDAGQTMMDAGDAMAPDAAAQTGECVVGPTGSQGSTGPQGAQGPAGPPGPPAAAMQFVGRTTDTFNGAQGMLTFTQACQADFGPGHRMCTSEEILNTVDLPTLAGGPSWVRPVFAPVAGGVGFIVDMSGVGENSQALLSCQGWNDANSAYRGVTVDAGGSFELLGCNGGRTIACCGPK